MNTHEKKLECITWNLKELYAGADDPEIFQDLQKASNKALKFVDLYRNRVREKSDDPTCFHDAIKEYERIHLLGMKPYLYATLLFASNTQKESHVKLLFQVKEKWILILQKLIFFTNELMELPDDTLLTLSDKPALQQYRNFFHKLYVKKPHRLSEIEEKIINLKNLSGRDSFTNFYSEFLGSLSIFLDINGRKKKLSLPEAIDLFNSPQRKLRENVMFKTLKVVKQHGLVFRTILNALITDHRVECHKRRHLFPMHRMLIENDLGKHTAENLIKVTESKYSLARKFLRLKAKMFRNNVIKISDVFAPVHETDLNLNLHKAQKLIINALDNFNPLLAKIALQFFEKRWIDTEIRKGKKEGAFCTSFIPVVHPFVSLHFGGKLKDLLTMAHELGHGIHFFLASENTYLNFMPPFVIGEAMATFTELIIAHHLLENHTKEIPEDAILECLLDNFLLTVFRQNLITRFEQTIHDISGSRQLGTEELCHIWWGLNKELYGTVVEIDSSYQWGWTYVSHIFRDHFYCFSYVFGGLLAHCMYKSYQTLGLEFTNRLIELMKMGGSRSTGELLKIIGIEISEKEVWLDGFRIFEDLMKRYATIKSIQVSS